jgi:hypothetical protein
MIQTTMKVKPVILTIMPNVFDADLDAFYGQGKDDLL